MVLVVGVIAIMQFRPTLPSLTNVWFWPATFFLDAIRGAARIKCVMHRTGFTRLLALLGGVVGFGLGAMTVAAGPLTTIAQLRAAAEQSATVALPVVLEGDVWWANAAPGRFVLRDATGAEALELELADDFPQAGQRVRLEGTTTVARSGYALRLGTRGPVVDNNGVHALIEKSGSVYLTAGRQPIRLEWFNGVEGLGLEVEYEGPELPRQKIPTAALFTSDRDATGPSNGLAVAYHDFSGNLLPEGLNPPPLQTGVVTNFTLAGLPRAERIGAVFSGWLAAPRAGLYTFHLKSDDGSRLFIGKPTLRLTPLGPATLPPPQRLTVGQILPATDDATWGEVEGKVTLVRPTTTGCQLELTAGAGHMLVELGVVTNLAAAFALEHARVRATGFCRSVRTADGQNVAGILLVPTLQNIQRLESPQSPPLDAMATNANGLPVLTTAGEVHRLKREEAQRAYPVKIRGVVTCVLPEHQAFTIQDGTRGIYVEDRAPERQAAPAPGEFLEVEGTTDPSLFAPIITARRIHRLGAGRLPEPVQPTWDQLINGSLDAQRVELQGIVTAVHTNELTLLMRGGVVRIELRLAGQQEIALQPFANALVRIRGCLFASWDYVTHQVRMGDVRIYAADLLVEQAAPQDLFSSPRKTASELLLFDPQAGVFQRVKVTGQIVHRREAEYFLMDGERGLRFTTKQPIALETGDTVEVVGFPDLLGSAAPVLREAVVRKTGHAPLPAARTLTTTNLIQTDYDATRVKVEGLLVNVRQTKTDTVLEMQNGVRTFIAHLTDVENSLPSLANGSRLELTGVYSGLGGNRAAGQDIAAFELLLGSAADIKVLARPPWWTLKRLLFIVGALACVLTAAALWITQLHRQVEERTAELGAQIQERQRLEHQRAMEAERTRIAQDLHDELGSGITEMSMLAARAKSAASPNEKRSLYLDQVGGKARELVTGLDEIVWAMNPRHDSLSSLVSYFSLYADRFLGLAGLAWQLENPTEQADRAIDSRRRHQLFLAFKEALTNVVRHSGATEVRLSIRCENERLKMSIADNGRGFQANATAAGMDGIANMRARIEKLGGQFAITSTTDRGTTVRFDVPMEF